MKTQDLYDLMCHHLRKQGKPSATNSDCMYRGPGGTACAVGLLISDEEYDEQMEGKLAHDSRVQEAVESSLDIKLSKDDLFLLDQMQDAHDSWAREISLETLLEQHLIDVAARCDLAYSEPSVELSKPLKNLYSKLSSHLATAG